MDRSRLIPFHFFLREAHRINIAKARAQKLWEEYIDGD